MSPLIFLLLAIAAGKLQRALSEKELIREEVRQMVETSKLAKARTLLKSELERLRKFAAEAHSPAADIADQDSQIPYLRLGAEDAQGAAESAMNSIELKTPFGSSIGKFASMIPTRSPITTGFTSVL